VSDSKITPAKRAIKKKKTYTADTGEPKPVPMDLSEAFGAQAAQRELVAAEEPVLAALG